MYLLYLIIETEAIGHYPSQASIEDLIDPIVDLGYVGAGHIDDVAVLEEDVVAQEGKIGDLLVVDFFLGVHDGLEVEDNAFGDW